MLPSWVACWVHPFASPSRCRCVARPGMCCCVGRVQWVLVGERGKGCKYHVEGAGGVGGLWACLCVSLLFPRWEGCWCVYVEGRGGLLCAQIEWCTGTTRTWDAQLLVPARDSTTTPQLYHPRSMAPLPKNNPINPPWYAALHRHCTSTGTHPSVHPPLDNQTTAKYRNDSSRLHSKPNLPCGRPPRFVRKGR